MKYKPALPRGSWLNTSDTGDRTGFSGSPESWIRYRNSYRNTLIWNVGAFFDRILPKANMKNATIIYTSDHGQNLHERGGEGVTTHCSPDPVPEEGLVPLVVIDAANSPYKTAKWNWGDSVHAEFNRSSHFRIFPTMLEMMGYNQKQVTDLYGQNLFTRNADPFSFNYVFNARLGRDPEWKKIKLNDIAYPPISDFSSKPR